MPGPLGTRSYVVICIVAKKALRAATVRQDASALEPKPQHKSSRANHFTYTCVTPSDRHGGVLPVSPGKISQQQQNMWRTTRQGAHLRVNAGSKSCRHDPGTLNDHHGPRQPGFDQKPRVDVPLGTRSYVVICIVAKKALRAATVRQDASAPEPSSVERPMLPKPQQKSFCMFLLKPLLAHLRDTKL